MQSTSELLHYECTCEKFSLSTSLLDNNNNIVILVFNEFFHEKWFKKLNSLSSLVVTRHIFPWKWLKKTNSLSSLAVTMNPLSSLVVTITLCKKWMWFHEFLKKHLTTLWDIGNCTLKNLLNTKMTMYFSKFYGKVGVISWFLFHLIWKNYVLYWDFDLKSWIVDCFTKEKHHKTTFPVKISV